MSIIDDFWNNIFNKKNAFNNSAVTSGKAIKTYSLNSTRVIDTEIVRGIYKNTNNKYKLSAGLVRPIINSDVSFIGKPKFIIPEKDANKSMTEELETIQKNNNAVFEKAHRLALREGDCYIWIRLNDKNEVEWNILTADKLDEIIVDPISFKPLQYRFAWTASFLDKSGNVSQADIRLYIDDEFITTRYIGYGANSQKEQETVPNVIGVLPVIQISNEKEPYEVKGHSEIEAIEPYLKAYHDVLMDALQANNNNSQPRLKFKVDNVKSFVDNNFGQGTWEKVQAGTESVSIKDLDLILLRGDDEAEYLQLSNTDGYKSLLEILFYLIAETAEVLEIIFGAHLETSRASTDNQLPVYTKKIERKQESFGFSWKETAEVSLKMLNYSNLKSTDPDVEVLWCKPDFENEKEKADRLKTFVDTMKEALRNGILPFEQVFEENKKYFDTNDDFDKHLEKIRSTAKLLALFEEDSMTQSLEEENENV